MENKNIIVGTPNVKGDISSCETRISTVGNSTRDSIFFVNTVSYATNNCTGKTEVFNSWEFSDFSAILFIVVFFIVFLSSVIITSK